MSALYCLFLCSHRMSISCAVCFNSFSIFSLITYIICSDMHSQQLKRAVIMTSCGYVAPKATVTVSGHWVAVQGCFYSCHAKLSRASTHPVHNPHAFGYELQPLIAPGLGCCLPQPHPHSRAARCLHLS